MAEGLWNQVTVLSQAYLDSPWGSHGLLVRFEEGGNTTFLEGGPPVIAL